MSEVPGHSAGHVVLFDEASGILLASDAVGSNRPTITDSLLMQLPGMAPIDDLPRYIRTSVSSVLRKRRRICAQMLSIWAWPND